MERTSREAWAKRVERWKDSGLTAAEYAAETGIKAHTLSWWRWRLGGGVATAKGATKPARRVAPKPAELAPPKPSVTFVEMPSVATPGGSSLELVLRSSTRIVVPPDFDATALGRLLDVLEARG
jgi:hypothetical protein